MPERYSEYDLYLSFVKGGPSLGDPLERSVEDVEMDLNEEFVMPEFAERVYGVMIEHRKGRFDVNREETQKRRSAILAERGRRAIPVSEWIKTERTERVIPKRVIEPLAEMYRSSMELSPQWAKEYREFWGLDDDFAY